MRANTSGLLRSRDERTAAPFSEYPARMADCVPESPLDTAKQYVSARMLRRGMLPATSFQSVCAVFLATCSACSPSVATLPIDVRGLFILSFSRSIVLGSVCFFSRWLSSSGGFLLKVLRRFFTGGAFFFARGVLRLWGPSSSVGYVMSCFGGGTRFRSLGPSVIRRWSHKIYCFEGLYMLHICCFVKSWRKCRSLGLFVEDIPCSLLASTPALRAQ